MDCSGDTLENAISYLFRISESLPQNYPIPKSYYASKSRILELKGQVRLPTKLTKGKIRCPRCCLNFSEYPPNVRLMPKRKNDRFAKKLLKKVEEGKPLTCYQEKFRKILLKKSDKNTLVRSCQFCKNEIKANIQFPIKLKTKEAECTPKVSQKKKKNKKDKFAGLTPSAVISVNQTKVNNIKKSVTQILQDNELKQKENKSKEVGKIEGKKKKKKKKKTVEISPVKSTKMKINEAKEMKADKKQKNKIKNLLRSLDKPTASNVLSGFLQSL